MLIRIITVITAVFAVFILLSLSSGTSSALDMTELAGFKVWTGDLDGMKKRRLIRILVPYSKTIYFTDWGRQFGTAVEFGQALDKWLNAGKKKEIERIRIAFVAKPRDQLIPALNQGLGDIIAANLTITPERQLIVDFTAPLLTGVKEVLVIGPSAPDLRTLQDLAGREIFVRSSSSYREHLQKANADFRKLLVSRRS